MPERLWLQGKASYGRLHNQKYFLERKMECIRKYLTDTAYSKFVGKRLVFEYFKGSEGVYERGANHECLDIGNAYS